jgi:hypothetical protein
MGTYLEVYAAKIRFLTALSIRLFFAAVAYLTISTLYPAATNAEEFNKNSGTEHETSVGTATVYLIDKSSSMLWVYDELRESLKEAARGSGPQDSLCIILFGDTTTMLASYKSMNESKQKKLAKLIDSVYPDSFYTNLTLAIEQGMESLHAYFENEVAKNYVLVLVTDGKNHPSPDYVQDRTIEETLTRFPDFLPGEQWSLRYFALESQVDPELLSVVEKYGEGFFDVEKIAESTNSTQEEIVESLLKVPQNTLAWRSLDIRVVDQSGIIEVKKKNEETWTILPKGSRERLRAGDSIAVESDSKAAISIGGIGRAGLKDNTHLRIDDAEMLPLQNSTKIKMKLEKGTIWNAIDAPKEGGMLMYEVVTPIAVTAVRGTVLRIKFDPVSEKQSVAVVEGHAEMSSPQEEPAFEKFSLAGGTYSEISPGQPPSPPSPIPKEIIREWGRWLKSLIWKNPFSRINFEDVHVTPAMTTIEMGPIKPNQKFSQFIPIRFDKEYFGEEPITPHTAIDLPPGVSITLKIVDREDEKLMKNILVTLECPPYLRHTGTDKYQGQIQLRCPNPDIVFTKSYVGLEVTHSRPGFISRMRDFIITMKTVILVVGGILGFLGLLAAWTYRRTLRKWKNQALAYSRRKLVKMRLIHFLRARPSGHIVMLSAPFEVQAGGAFDLADVSRRSGNVIIEIGSNGSNAIVLPHDSVRPFHCQIWASRQRNPTQIFIESCSDGHLTVNGEQTQEYRQLHDQDVIQIGECEFQFADRQYSHQVRVRMLDGTVYEGRLEYWDVSHSVFYITDKSGEKDEFLPLRFSQASHVHFFRDESERDVDIMPRGSEEKKRKPVKITLSTGRKLRGYVDRKFKYKGATGVFLYPAPGVTNIEFTYIPRNNIASFMIVDLDENG